MSSPRLAYLTLLFPNFTLSKNILIFFKKLLLPPNESHFRFHWPLAPRSAVEWIKSSCCVESSKHRAVERDVLMTLRSPRICFAEPPFAARRANEKKNCSKMEGRAPFWKFLGYSWWTWNLGHKCLISYFGATYLSKMSYFRHVNFESL